MPLYILDNFGSEMIQKWVADLVKANPDPFFTQPAAIQDDQGNALVEVTYSQSVADGKTWCERFMSSICNETPNYNIELVGVTSSFTLPGGSPIVAHGSGTYFNLAASEWILVFIDVNDCSGEHYHVFAPDGSQLIMLPQELVAHELSHAMHVAQGNSPTNVSAAEQQAIADENMFRGQYGFKLRDEGNHAGGCGYTGHEPNFWDGVCFVVSAASGSTTAPRVQHLRFLRDRLFRDTRLGYLLFDDFWLEYYQYSPQIARAVGADPFLRRAIDDWLIGPYVSFLEAALTWASEQNRIYAPSGISSVMEDGRRCCGHIRSALFSERPPMRPAWRSEAMIGPETVGGFIGAVIARSLRAWPMTTWALLEPVEMWWSAAASGLNINFASWLARMPIPARYASLGSDVIAADLEKLFANAVSDDESQRAVNLALAQVMR